ncbi:FAD-dependent oxidoreductase [bacterium]|nr:FAD-dependent oxidoreductase [bacterium]
MKVDVLVIGGSAAGIVGALTAKSNYPEKTVLLVRKEEKTLVPCGIPYIFGELGGSDKNIIPDAGLQNGGVDLKIAEVIEINKNEKKCKLSTEESIEYEKLIIATGSIPSVPKWLKGANLENVFTIPKDKVYLDEMLTKIESLQNIVVIGAGFIGVEISDELKKAGKNVTVIEKQRDILSLAFDEDVSKRAQSLLESRGVVVKTGCGIKEVLGDRKAEAILLENGETVKADAVILSIGYQPNTILAKNSGIKINERGFIVVDEYMRTDDTDIFAIGDCAEKRDFFTRKLSSIMLASTATSEARVAGMNLYILSAVKTFGGTIAIFSTAFGGTGFAAAGLTECMAKKEGYSIITGSFEGVDKHPGTLKNTHKQFVKLVVAKESGVILGGEVVGGESSGELINIIGLAIQNKMTIGSILTAQIGTHPLLTSAPTNYPLIKAAQAISQKIRESLFRN